MDVNKLASIAKTAKCRDIPKLFTDESRVNKFSLTAANIFLDYSKQNISSEELCEALKLCESVNLDEKIKQQFNGAIINRSEKRAVLHTILRAPDSRKKEVLGGLTEEVIETNLRMSQIVSDICNQKHLGCTGKVIKNVLAIGIGGSFYGVKVGLSALKSYQTTGLNVDVLANIDGAAVKEKLQRLEPENTLVIVISKTFTTQETLLNARLVKDWMLEALPQESISKQWIGVTSNTEAAQSFGLNENYILPMWDWVGGRFSVWSAVGLPLALAIGNKNFEQFKEGAYQMDEHFRSAEFRHNMPVLLALLGVWNRNGLNYPSLAILPYDHALRALPGYLQQTDMESNGKSVSIDGSPVNWVTSPIVFGQEGTNAQHAFMQLMHQSLEIIPTDFIVCLKGTSEFEQNHKLLVANCFAQSEALMHGKTIETAKSELLEAGVSEQEIDYLAIQKSMKGNTPSNTLLLEKLTPESFGSMLALYEHKIFVQGVFWQLNSFDQWGVELGKSLGKDVESLLDGEASQSLSSSCQNLVKLFKQGTIS